MWAPASFGTPLSAHRAFLRMEPIGESIVFQTLRLQADQQRAQWRDWSTARTGKLKSQTGTESRCRSHTKTRNHREETPHDNPPRCVPTVLTCRPPPPMANDVMVAMADEG